LLTDQDLSLRENPLIRLQHEQLGGAHSSGSRLATIIPPAGQIVPIMEWASTSEGPCHAEAGITRPIQYVRSAHLHSSTDMRASMLNLGAYQVLPQNIH